MDPARSSSPGALWCALERLDARLRHLAETAEDSAARPGPPAETLTAGLSGYPPFAALGGEYRLTGADLDVLVIALAPTVDLRYPAAYRTVCELGPPRQPTVDLVLEVLGGRGSGALEQRMRFATTGPLVGGGAIHLEPDPAEPSWLADCVEVDPQVVRVVHGDDDLDPRLTAWCSLAESGGDLAALPPGAREYLARVTGHADAGAPMLLYLRGSAAVDGGGRALARALAGALRQRLLLLDVPRLLDTGADPAAAVARALREARLFGRVSVLEEIDALAAGPAWPRVLATLAEHPGATVLTGIEALPPGRGAGPGMLTVPLPVPDAGVRHRVWTERLAAAGIAADPDDVAALAAGFRFTSTQIGAAVRTAAVIGGGGPGGVDRPVLLAAARAQSRPELTRLAVRVTPRARRADLVLPEDALAALRELGDRVALRHRVLDEWGLGASTTRGNGVSALFLGPSGTGKTMAAEVVAGELGLEVYRVDLAGVVSKYLGETEKNLGAIFAAAEHANAVLLFDEADALFGKRSEVKDSHDRYANVEIAYLLQRLEAYDGLAVLTSNLPRNIDEAFARRLTFTVHFPFPDEATRRLLWAGAIPARVPLGADVDPANLARRFKISGGTIHNAVLAGAYRAAAAERAMELADLVHGVRREYQKLGKALDNGELRSGP